MCRFSERGSTVKQRKHGGGLNSISELFYCVLYQLLSKLGILWENGISHVITIINWVTHRRIKSNIPNERTAYFFLKNGKRLPVFVFTKKENFFILGMNYSQIFHDKKTVIKMVIRR